MIWRVSVAGLHALGFVFLDLADGHEMLQSPMAEDDTPRATTVLEGGHGLPLSDGNASPMSLRSCCQNVASRFAAFSYYTGISGFRKAGDLGFEPRLTDPESVVLPLHQSPSGCRVRVLRDCVRIRTSFRPLFQAGRQERRFAARGVPLNDSASSDVSGNRSIPRTGRTDELIREIPVAQAKSQRRFVSGQDS